MAAYAQGGIKYARKHLQRVWLWLKQPHAILPTHDLRRLVHLCSIGAGLWTAIISPILLAVPLQVEQENAPRLWAPWAPQVIIISTICDAVLCCEALLCATTAYHVHTSQGATVHMERRIVKTASRYLRSWWSLVDAVSAMPAAITLFLILAAEGGAHTAAGAIALVRIMLLLKGVSAVRLFVLLHQKLDARRSTPSATAQQLLFLLLATFFVWHWASCIFLAIAATSSAGARVQMSQSMTPAGSPTLVDQANRSQVTQVADSARNQTGMSCVQDKEALLAASLSVQYHCALVWASHIVSLSGGHDSAPWGAGERLVSVSASWISLLGVGCLVHRAYTLLRLSDGASEREFSANVSFSAIEMVRQRVQEAEPHGNANLAFEWLPAAGTKDKIVRWIGEVGAHVRCHQRGTNDVREIRGYDGLPASRGHSSRGHSERVGGGGALLRGLVREPDALLDHGGQQGPSTRMTGRKVRYGWRSWGRGDEDAEPEIGGFAGSGGGLTEGLRVRTFLELHGLQLSSVTYLQEVIRHASENLGLAWLAASPLSHSRSPSLPAQQLWGQHAVDFLLRHWRVQEYREGDMVVFIGEVLTSVQFLVRGKMHVADGGMWPEAENRRMQVSGVRFNLATSARAINPDEAEETNEVGGIAHGGGDGSRPSWKGGWAEAPASQAHSPAAISPGGGESPRGRLGAGSRACAACLVYICIYIYI